MIAAKPDPAPATTPTKANCEPPLNSTRLSTMAWVTLSPDPTATAPYATPNAPAYRPRPTAARSGADRLGAVSDELLNGVGSRRAPGSSPRDPSCARGPRPSPPGPPG